MTKTKKETQKPEIIWKLEKRKISDSTPHPKNPRHFTEKGMKDLESSINSIGFASPVNINQNGTILGGHARILKLQEMGQKEVDVYVPNQILTPEQEDEVIIRLNANTAGEWDFDKLANEFDIGDLNEWGLEIPNFNTEPEETVGDDDVPEEPKKAITVKGDLYQLGQHRLLCADSTMIDEVEKLMDGKKADMVFTDPPYGVSAGGGRSQTVKKLKMTAIANDELRNEDLEQFIVDALSLIPLIENGSFYVCYDQKTQHQFSNALKTINWTHKNTIIWNKNNFDLSGHKGYRPKFELIAFGFTGEEYNWYGDNSQADVWDIDRPTDRPGNHPTPKPVELVEKAIKNSSKEDDIVVDIFLGSGSTLIACEKTKRICYGMELDPKYCDVIVKRYIDFCEKNSIKPIVKRNGKDCLKEFKE